MNKQPPSRKLSMILVLSLSVVLILITVACAPSTLPAATPAPTPSPLLYITVVVTRVPTATPTLPPTPTLPYNITPLLGEWSIVMNFNLRGNRVFSDVRFIGSATLQVNLDGLVTGSIEFYPTVYQLPCVASVLDSEPLRAAITGTLRRAPDNTVISDLTLQPDKPLQPTSLRLFCPDFKVAYDSSEPLLWPALKAVYGLSFSFPFRSGFSEILTADLTGPGSGGLRGLLISDIRLGR
jgi:hypothetical protein